MEALILSCSTGGGHNSAGKAIQKALDARGWHTTFLDPYSLRSQKMADRVGSAYVDLVRLSPQAFGMVYQIGQAYVKAEHALCLPNPVLAVQRKTAWVLYDYLQKQPVDLIICTHPYPGLMLTWLKQHGKSVPPSIMVATDYACIPFEEDVQTDWFVIPHPDLVPVFKAKGVQESHLLPIGIPVDPKLGVLTSKKRAAAALGLDPERQYILIGGGSMGTGGIWPVIHALKPMVDEDSSLCLIVLCGSSKKMYDRVAKIGSDRILPVSFTSRMYEYLHLASLYITKPGGLSITEAAACGTPLILTQAIPGCETSNAQFFLRHGLADLVEKPEDLPAAVELEFYAIGQGRRKPDDFFRHNTDRMAEWCAVAAGLNSRRQQHAWDAVLSAGDSSVCNSK